MEFALPKITKKIITELKEINQQFLTALKQNNSAAATEYDARFHGLFLKLADNYFLKEFHEFLQTHIQRIQLVDDPYYSLVSKGEGSYKEHAALIEALEAKDLNAATAAMRANWETTILVANSKAPSD